MRRLRCWVVGLAVLVALAGCVRVPTSGSLEKVEGEQPVCQSCINIEVAPPNPGDDQEQIVEGFLRASSNFQRDYSTARQFLTRAARQTWNPDDSASIYRGKLEPDGNTVTLVGDLIGSLDQARTFKRLGSSDLAYPFKLVREGGEWRIDSLPSGLLVTENSFENSYKPYNLYYLARNGGSLVPETIYLPSLRSPQNVASALMTALLAGPTKWLAPLVSSPPAGTSLNINSVTITDGVADVPLSDNIMALGDAERSQLAAQIVYTLKEAGLGIKGVSITVNQARYRLPEADPNTQVMSVDAVPRELEPVSVLASDQLYVVTRATDTDPGGWVATADGTAETLTPLTNELGGGPYRLGSIAVSVANTDVAAVTEDGTQLLAATLNDKRITPVLAGVSGLLRPQYSRYGDLWTIGYEDGKQRMWTYDGNEAKDVRAPVLDTGRVTAFRISPDGVRMALIRREGKNVELGLARINRGDRLIVDSWRPLNLNAPTAKVRLPVLTDLAWLDASDLVVLGRADSDTAVTPYKVSADASEVAPLGDPDNWRARELAVQQRTQTVIIRGSGGATFRDDGTSWLPYVKDVQALAYPG